MTPRAANAGVVSRHRMEASTVNDCTTSPETDNLKQCSKCGEWKPATTEHFRARKDRPGKLRSQCRNCDCADTRRNYRENPDRKLEYQREYASKNADKIREQKREYRLANAEKVLAQLRARQNARRARERQAEGNHTPDDVRRQYDSQRGKCWWCGKKVGKNYHVDHRVPLSRGGSNAPDNIVVACVKCNLSKHSRLPHEWCDRLL